MEKDQKYYAEIFATAGRSYDTAMTRNPNARDAEFKTAVRLLQLYPGFSLLDVPAGGGYLEQYLPSHCGYTALDFSAGFGHGNKVGKCTEGELGTTSSRFDRVVCLASLHHIEDRQAFFAEIKRTLKPGGQVLIGDVLAGSREANFLNDFCDRWNSLGHAGDFITPTREEQELTEIGLDVSISQHRYDWEFASDSDALDYVRLLFNLDKTPSDEALLGELRDMGLSNREHGVGLPWSLTFLRAGLPS